MNPIRVLIVDDSVVIRKVLTEALSTDLEIEVIGSASDGRLALAKIEQLHPDLVTLDIEMPGMNGLEALAALRKLYPKLPVIMFSHLTERGAAATMEALSFGASDYGTKPINAGSVEATANSIRMELIPKIKALCGQRGMLPVPAATHAMPRRKLQPAGSRRIDVVAIGSSTGGPNALAELLPHFPKDFPVPIVMVQHMPPIFTRLLTERLGGRCAIQVHEGSANTVLVPASAWIAPGDWHMRVRRSGVNVRLDLNQEAPENSCRPAVDVLFRSIASVYAETALGVVMTGMGSDGMIGAQHIREAGGEVIIQDQASSVVWGMPGAVQAAGNADAVYPLKQLGPEILRRVMNSHARGNPCLDRPNTGQAGAK